MKNINKNALRNLILFNVVSGISLETYLHLNI